MPERTDLPSVRTVIKIKNYTNHFLLKPVIWQSAKGMCSAALSLPLIQRLFTELYQIMQASASFLSGRLDHWCATSIFSSQMLMIKGEKKTRNIKLGKHCNQTVVNKRRLIEFYEWL